MKRYFRASPWGRFHLGALLALGAITMATGLRAQDTFEPDDTPATAKRIANGVVQTRSLEAGDIDWAIFTIGPGGAANVRIETAALTAPAIGNTEIWLYDARDLTKEIAHNDDAIVGQNLFSLIALSSLAPGTYLIKVAAVGATASVNGYNLRAMWTDRPDAYESDDTPAAAKRIAQGEAQERSLHVSGDVDWVTFTVGSNGVTNVRIETSGNAADTEMWLYGPNSATAQLAYNDDAGGSKSSVITVNSLSEGTYFIKVNSFAFGSTISAYTLRVTWAERGDGFEADDTPQTARAIVNGQTQNRSLHMAGDVDWATFTTGPNGASSVRIETAGAPAGDTELFLYGPNSSTTLFAYNDDAPNGKFSLITLNSLPPGTYYIKVSEFGNDGTIAAYTLRATWSDAPAPTPGDSFESDDVPTNAKSIARGQTQARSIHTETDVDWAMFTIGANGAFDVRVETLGNSGDTEMWLYGPDNFNTQLSYNDDGGGSGKFAGVTLSTLSAGTYYIKVASYRQGSVVGSYSLRVNWTESSIAPAATRLINLSIRTNAGTDAQTVIVGFVLSGTGMKQLLMRAVGPTLASFGVTAPLADPALQLFRDTTTLSTNDNWGGDAEITAAAASVSAFPLPAASRDAALLQPFAAGNYTVQVAGGTGIVLVEAYEVGGSGLPRLSNISARAQVGTGANVLIAGFVVAGPSSKTVLIRAVGPALTQFGVTGALVNPRLDVYRGTTLMESNDNWGGTAALTAAFAQVGAFTLPASSNDSALLLTLQPGAYSAQISGVNNTTGTALVEVYEVP